MPTNTDKKFTPNSKDIRYVNRDFSQLRESLIRFAKTYYPNSYKDFSDASPGMMFIEQAAYVGDVLSYYTDYSFKEGLLQDATERKNIIALARTLGYKVKAARGASGTVELYQICPAMENDLGEYVPNPQYALLVKENMQVVNNSNNYFVTSETVDFSVSSSSSPRVDSVYSRNPDGTPSFFLLEKDATVSSGQIVTKEVVVNSPEQFYKVYLDEDNVLGVLDVYDSDGNRWYEVDYLSQELVLTDVPNDISYEGTLTQYSDSVPYILKRLRTSKRFTTQVDENNLTYLEFGAGLEGFDDEVVNLSSKTVGYGLRGMKNSSIPYDPANFLKNSTFGVAPANTTLRIRYIVGGGISSNAPTNDIRSIVSVDFNNPSEGLTPEESDLLSTVKSSLQVNNKSPITGGKDSETNEEIKLNAMSFFATQNRAVTVDDYLVRVYSMLPKYGSIAKAQVVTNSGLSVNIKKILTGDVGQTTATVTNNNSENQFRRIAYDISNPFSINLYVLCYDDNKHLIPPNSAVITNLIEYIKSYKMLTDNVNIIDGYVVNIGVDFKITVYKGFNKKEVLKDAISAIKSFFDIDNWNFSQSINLSQLQLEIAKVDGVQSVAEVKVVNKTSIDGNYSAVQYDMAAATKDNVIYPSIDPCIFECKYPDSDIRGLAL